MKISGSCEYNSVDRYTPEGLLAQLTKGLERGLFCSYYVHPRISFPILQFVDNTIISCVDSVENLW